MDGPSPHARPFDGLDPAVKELEFKDGVPAIWQATGGFEHEADVVGSRLAPSLKLEHKPEPGRVAQVASGDLDVSKLFDDEQEAVIKAALPDGHQAGRPEGARPRRRTQVGPPGGRRSS